VAFSELLQQFFSLWLGLHPEMAIPAWAVWPCDGGHGVAAGCAQLLLPSAAQRYSEPARRVIFYSRYMASQFGSPEIETEHLVLGLLRADMVLARRFLGSPWAAEEIWREIERDR
jgi:hypothetical protein